MAKTTRREFLGKSIKAGLAIPLIGATLASCKKEVRSENLSILILGGTSFLGPHQIATALTRGHKVTTFTRGKTQPTVHQDLFNQVEMLVGDRENNLKALENRKWDIVIDNSGRKAEWTEATAKLLKKKASIYIYISSTGVYYPYLDDLIAEDKDLVTEVPKDAEGEEKYEYDYGVMKTLSEKAALDEFGEDRTLVIRPTYMVGPADKTNRFIHWPIRLAKGGEVLVPGKVNDPVQYVDVRDIADWIIKLAEERIIGTFNAVGPESEEFIYEFVERASKAFEVEHTFIKIPDDEFLLENKIPYLVPWIMPIDNNASSSKISNEAAKNQGLTFRPLVQTIRDTHDWWYSDSVSEEIRSNYENDSEGLLVREQEVIKSWKQMMNM